MKSNISAKDILQILHKAHLQPEWVFFSELRCGSGYSKAAQKRIDAWALNCYPSKDHIKVAYEIKVYRSDFLNEMKDPKKRKQGLNLSNQFYFVAPEGVIKLDEVPVECGYLEVTTNHKLKIRKEAPLRTCKDPSWLFVSSLARRTVKHEGVSFSDLTDSVVKRLMDALYMGDKKIVNGAEHLLYDFIQKEYFRRANAAENKRTKEQKRYNAFVNRMRKQNCYISWDAMQNKWQEYLAKQIRK